MELELDVEIIQAVGVTCEIINAPPMSLPATRIFCGKLARYDKAQVLGALDRCQSELSGRLSLEDVVRRLDDGRPGAEEAWAMVPRDEDSSAVLSEDIAQAMGAVGELAFEDRVAGRMAFKEAYARIIQSARDCGRPVKWFFSAGRSVSARADCLTDAVIAGRLALGHVLGILPPHDHQRVLDRLPASMRPALPAPVNESNRKKLTNMLAGILRAPDAVSERISGDQGTSP